MGLRLRWIRDCAWSVVSEWSLPTPWWSAQDRPSWQRRGRGPRPAMGHSIGIRPSVAATGIVWIVPRPFRSSKAAIRRAKAVRPDATTNAK